VSGGSKLGRILGNFLNVMLSLLFSPEDIQALKLIHILIYILFLRLALLLSKRCQKNSFSREPFFHTGHTLLKEMAALVQNKGTVEALNR
jgi:hypothetical protein